MSQSLVDRSRRSDRRGAVLLRPDSDHRDAARYLLCGRDDPVSQHQRDPHLRLPAVRDEADAIMCASARRRWPCEAGVTNRAHRQGHIRKEAVVARVLAATGRSSRLGAHHLGDGSLRRLSPWHDKQTHKTFIRPDSGKCLHYYFYFIDARFGLIYLRVPTWCPFRLQFYCNGHSWLARKLTANGIGYTMADNAFVRIDDWSRAQELADRFSPDQLHRTLDRYAERCCPVIRRVRTVLSLEPDAGGIRHRSGIPLRRHPRPALRTTGPGSRC